VNGSERLLAACRRQPVDATPVWFMRQAGGSLPAYRSLRARHSVLEIAKTPALCAEVTCAAVETLGVDGAVLFADIMLPVEAMGVDVELSAYGPVIADPVRTARDVARLRAVDPRTDLGFVLEAVGLTRRALGDRAAVIGLAGGPFTLAAYLIEGGPSRDQLRTRALMHGAPETWDALLGHITDVTVGYLAAQVEAGAQVLQVFDSWAGSLSAADYVRFVRPHAARIMASVADVQVVADVPVVHFAAGTGGILEAFAGAGGTVMGVDERQSIGNAWRRIGPAWAVQGNLDPARVLAGWGPAAEGARAVLAEVAGRPGHVFNLGHAAPREADPVVLRDLVRLIHEESPASGRPSTLEVAIGA
jgi:uroporphyrinogen decarboxylase